MIKSFATALAAFCIFTVAAQTGFADNPCGARWYPFYGYRQPSYLVQRPVATVQPSAVTAQPVAVTAQLNGAQYALGRLLALRDDRRSAGCQLLFASFSERQMVSILWLPPARVLGPMRVGCRLRVVFASRRTGRSAIDQRPKSCNTARRPWCPRRFDVRSAGRYYRQAIHRRDELPAASKKTSFASRGRHGPPAATPRIPTS